MGCPMNYYVYENWTAENKAVIHRADCGFCKDGKGCHNNSLGNKNGQWNGPYQYFNDAVSAAKATGRPVKIHSCVLRVTAQSTYSL